jgi:hypothetical protein
VCWLILGEDDAICTCCIHEEPLDTVSTLFEYLWSNNNGLKRAFSHIEDQNIREGW